MIRPIAVLFGLIACLVGVRSLASEVGCEDADIISGKMLTDICWDCIMPFTVAGVPMGGGGSPPEGSSNKRVCNCPDDNNVPRPGAMTSYWEPARLIEFQRVPGCSSVFNGMRFPINRLNMGAHAKSGTDLQGTFMHYHYYAFPLLSILDLFSNRGCISDGYTDLDMMYLSELDPTWNNDELAFFTNPEAATVANPLATAACVADAAAASTGHPINKLFWCAGTWGTIYPLSGNQYTNTSRVVNTSLLSIKVLTALHRRGLAHKTMGDAAMCHGVISATIPKSMYQFTVLHPLPETKEGHVVGESVFTWGLGRIIPAVGEDLIYTIWRRTDCCNVSGG